MRSSFHGQVRTVGPDVASTVIQGGKIKYSKILSKKEAKAKKGQAKPNVFPFGYMFDELKAADGSIRPEHRLPDGGSTPAQLVALSATMSEDNPRLDRKTNIGAAYTYLGQFIDHDITKTETLDPAVSSAMEAAFQAARAGASFSPLDQDRLASLVNKRMPALNLDSVLSNAAPRDEQGAMRVGSVTTNGVPARPQLPFTEPAELFNLHDLPRLPPTSTNEELDRRAQIGDPRNDENLVVAQLHVAFLRAHRRLVHDKGMSAAQADTALQQFYQAVVIQDFLPVVCDPAVVAAVLAAPGAFYRPTPDCPFMPMEFSVAAYRFGHSMVRERYNYNSEFSGQGGKPLATLADLFTFTAFSGQNFDLPTVPHNWIIDWTRWLKRADDTLDNDARPIDTLLAPGLMNLPQHQGVIAGTDVNILALRNLVRGYLLSVPTGQAVAQAVRNRLPQIEPLTAAQLRAVAKDASDAQFDALVAGGFDVRTPLWYYMLAEAAHVRATSGKAHLGPIASVIITEVLAQLVRLADDNFMSVPGWSSAIPLERADRAQLVDLFRFAQLFP
ncbi:peroxidase family protein [Variovorax sp.]|uniref:peroxidase family protein n=1 Tax=Variovorax sp. TaxID=1871043 RepID=UPI002D6634DF|nr:peroxidase family protein [Variovorax sp.]HYP83541.1 peroxidase family protein [Variovorax sp.]